MRLLYITKPFSPPCLLISSEMQQVNQRWMLVERGANNKFISAAEGNTRANLNGKSGGIRIGLTNERRRTDDGLMPPGTCISATTEA